MADLPPTRKITIVLHKDVTPKEELESLQALIAESGAVAEPTYPPEKLVIRGTPLRVVTDYSQFKVGQMVVAYQAGYPDSDGDYFVWYIAQPGGELSSDHINHAHVIKWEEKPVNKAPTNRGRRLRISDDG